MNLREVNELVQAGDKRLTVAADDLATAPETKDRVVISGVVHQIMCVWRRQSRTTLRLLYEINPEGIAMARVIKIDRILLVTDCERG